jgi:hypothetical protein
VFRNSRTGLSPEKPEKHREMDIPQTRAYDHRHDSIASLFEQEYGHRPRVVRNLPQRIETPVIIDRSFTSAQGRPLLLMQGSVINVRRGAEEAVMAMQYLPDTNLLYIGGGDVMPGYMSLFTASISKTRFTSFPHAPH